MGIKPIKRRRQSKRRLKTMLAQLAYSLEKLRLADYVEFLSKPGRLLFRNFLSGLARGFGVAIGFSILGAIVIYFLQQAAVLNMPVIGNFIADIVKIVNNSLSAK